MHPARNARVGPLVEAVPVTTTPRIHYSLTDLLTLGLLRPAWAYRVELALMLLATAAWLGLTHVTSRPVAGIVLVVLAGVVVAVPAIRNLLVRRLTWARLRRQWTRACRHANLATGNDRVPVIRTISSIPAGD